MGGDTEKTLTSVAHLALCCVGVQGIGRMRQAGYTHPGMHANLIIHGIVGFLHHQSAILGDDINAIYMISLKVARYLPLPCLNADLRRYDKTISLLHLASGVIPLGIALAGEENAPLGDLVIGLNIISLCHYAHTRHREFGWYTAGAGAVAYFAAPKAAQKFLFPLALALMEYCAFRLTYY